MRRELAVALALAMAAAGCARTDVPHGAPTDAASTGRALREAGKLDEARAVLEAAGEDAEALYELGRVWAKMAESAPLPAPPAPPSPIPRGWQPPPAPEFKAEELHAVRAFEQALARRPDHAAAHLALAQLLAPHAIRGHERQQATKGRRASGSAEEPDTAGVDLSSTRLLKSFEAAVAAQPPLAGALEGLQRFAERTGDLQAMEKVLQEQVRRAAGATEAAGPLVLYGDFLVSPKKDPMAAVEQYRQALIWRPDDDGTRGKLADIYIGLGIDSFRRQQYSTAAARFAEAGPYITDRESPRAARLREYEGRIAAIRGK